MTILQALALFFAAIVAGGLNSVAGGGSFISFPTLLATGIEDKIANATNTIALWPGSAASVGAYRKELTAQRRVLIPLSLVSLVGGLLGAIALLNTPQATFKKMVPFLLLFATLLFTFGSPLMARLRARRARLSNGPTPQGQAIQTILDDGKNPRWRTMAGISLLQFATAFYGGFFGGGIGIVMLAILNLMGMQNIHEMNALKTLLATCINGVAVVAFVIAGAIVWPQAILMIVGAIIGGYGGAYYARQLDPLLVRRFVIVVGFVMTVILFMRG
jgi:uncharacterized protein